jgi:hypothetical protein
VDWIHVALDRDRGQTIEHSIGDKGSIIWEKFLPLAVELLAFQEGFSFME